MIIKSLEIPDDLSQLGSWLDDQLVSPDLMDTILELQILAGDRLTTDQTIDKIRGIRTPAVVATGMSSVDASAMRQLLRQPRLLLELQETVLTHGGEFWQQKINQNSRSTAIPTWLFANEPVANQAVPIEVAHGNSLWNGKLTLGTIAAVTAMALLVFATWPAENKNNIPFAKDVVPPGNNSEQDTETPVPANSGWGFAASGLLTSPIDETQMLESLSKASLAWYNKVPSSKEQLKTRLIQFDVGCKELLSAQLPQLSAPNRDAVRNACQQCRSSIASQLADLQQGVDFDVALLVAEANIERLNKTILDLRS